MQEFLSVYIVFLFTFQLCSISTPISLPFTFIKGSFIPFFELGVIFTLKCLGPCLKSPDYLSADMLIIVRPHLNILVHTHKYLFNTSMNFPTVCQGTNSFDPQNRRTMHLPSCLLLKLSCRSHGGMLSTSDMCHCYGQRVGLQDGDSG